MPEPTKKVDFDEILKSVGCWGRFQNLYYIVLCCGIIFSVFPAMSYIFVARDIKYRCHVENCELENGDFNPEWLKNAVPYDNGVPSKCLVYQPAENTTCTEFKKNVTTRCQDFVYERKETTIVHDFDIKCDDNLWKLTIIGTVNVVGITICLPIAGFFSDRYGRKSMVIVSVFLSTIFGLLRSYSSSYLMYIILEFLNTVIGSGIYSGAFILAMEVVDSKKRNLGNSIVSLAFTIGHILLGVAAWLAPSWQFLLQILYLPGTLVTLLFYFIPESVRWLLSKNEVNKSIDILRLMAKVNGTELSQEMIDNIPYIEHPSKAEKNEKIPILSVLKNRKLLIRVAHCSFTWICCNFPYYGLTIQSVAISDDIYLNYMYVSLVEVPAYLFAFISLEKIGRRKTLAASLLLTGVACIGADFISNGTTLALIVFFSGKMFVTIAFMTIYIFTAELFPTNSRHSAFAVCSMFGGIGSMLAPQVPLLARLYQPLPLMVFAALAFTGGVLSFFFPENTEENNDEQEMNC